AAHPKIADYPFTTLTPNLGVVSMPDLRSFVVADFPGLIEGAHTGLGLGHKFLKHIERAALFVHLLDGSQILEDLTQPEHPEYEESVKVAAEKLIERYSAIRKELGLFSEKLLHKPEIVVINKLDVLESDPKTVERIRTALRDSLTSIRGTHPNPNEPFFISAVTGTGIQELLFSLQKSIDEFRGYNANEQAVLLPDSEGIRK
ncbi:GTPase, partial [Bdellovibrionota bacterium FG-2]